MRYVSIDVETTGMSADTNQLLEVGLVIEDTEKVGPVEELPWRRILIPYKEYQINTYCMRMHAKLFTELDEVCWDRLRIEGAYRHAPKTYYSLVGSIEQTIKAWLVKHLGDKKYVAAGKNFYGFDYKFLSPWLKELKFHHRALDPCILYLESDDVVPPDLPTCCKRAGIPLQDHHTAVGDARTVIELIRCR